MHIEDIELRVLKKLLDEFSIQRKQFVKDVEHDDILMVMRLRRVLNVAMGGEKF